MNAPATHALELDRTTYLGSSDIAAIMGISKWKTPLQCYLAKINGEAPVTASKKALFARGKRWEPIAADMLLDDLEDRYGKRPKVLARNQRYIDPEHSFLAAEIDLELEIDGEEVNAEIKTVDVRAAGDWGDVEDAADEEFEAGASGLTDDIPIYYTAQTMYGLMVRPTRKRCIVGALFGADRVAAYEVKRDDETIAAMRAKAVDFWLNHVVPQIPPAPVNMDDMMLLFARAKGRPVDLDTAAAELVENLRVIRGRIKTYKQDEKDVAFQIAEYVRKQWGLATESEPTEDKALLMFGGHKLATWNAQSRTTLDSKKLLEVHPELVGKFDKTSHFRVMRLGK